ncbi:MAG TPA: M4 family metallopeptidase, partial [Nitrososphaerales archaeon]
RDSTSWVNTELANRNKDHFADRNLDSGFRYDRGTILAHTAYLMAAGGVHQRTSRTPTLIPVYSIGKESRGGLDIYKAARIWYRALTWYFSTHGALTGIPTNDENTFRTLRNGCVSAAIDIYGTGSKEHLTTVLAFYASGLHPVGTNYGADVTFLRWGADWWLSKPYVGITSPDWSSVDLFINNGGTSEWNAQINILDSAGNPTQFENKVYCRVRNIGDQAATSIQIQFFYAKVGTAPSSWLPVTDKNGVTQTLTIATLTAGQSNFPDSSQNSPPASASIKWYIPPLATDETIDHFCLKAVATSTNDINPNNNEVQSNIAYAPTPGAAGFAMRLLVGNPRKETSIPLDLKIISSLPRKWKVNISHAQEKIILKPKEQRPLEIRIIKPTNTTDILEPPFDGDITGNIYGELSGTITGSLTNAKFDNDKLTGRISGTVMDIGTLEGKFQGKIDTKTAEITGSISARYYCKGSAQPKQYCIHLEGCLRPYRRIDISQWLEGQPLGGVTIQIQTPIPKGKCISLLPPTETKVKRPIKNKPLKKSRTTRK